MLHMGTIHGTQRKCLLYDTQGRGGDPPHKPKSASDYTPAAVLGKSGTLPTAPRLTPVAPQPGPGLLTLYMTVHCRPPWGLGTT